jgi:hypothetical protein
MKESTMKAPLPVVLLVLAASVSGAYAQSGLTREAVRSQIEEARRNGDLLAPGEAGVPQRQLVPGNYPRQPEAAGRSRAEVQAELREAQRTGNMLAAGETGLTAAQLNPSAYPAPPVVAGKTREQVRAETLQAIRDGDILGPGESGLTLRQQSPQTYLARERSQRQQHATGTDAWTRQAR